MAHPEQIHVVRLKLMPLILKILSDRASFPTTVRSVRLLQLIFSRLLFALAPECEVALSLLNHMLDADAATLWKRALCLEVFRGIYSEPALVRSIYSHYDEAEEQRNIVRDHLGSLVRLASEKPAIIGLGQQSSVPDLPGQEDFSGEQAALQAGGLIGSIGTVTVENIGNKTGISNQWSTVRIPCIDQLDKSEAPALPATYIYSLALTCITTFSDGLARFLLPFTVPTDHKAKRKQSALPDTEGDGKLERTQSFGGRRIPVNPLTLKEHVLYGQITTSGHMVDQCWPALLAASSTYLNAALDSENYHALVRSFQKFTQIAGLLDLSTPRDAFLTTLGKHAVPPMNTSVISLPSNTRDTKFLGEDLSDSDWDASPAALNQRRRSQDRPMPAMNTRHLLCLRALLNLGIALGPVLQYSWNIILEALQQADLIISLSAPGRRKQSRSGSRVEIEHRPGSSDGGEGLGLEITAAETAASRLFESTADLPNEAFRDFLKCISSLLQMDGPEDIFTNFTLSPQPAGRKHLKRRSISGVGVEGSTPAASIVFILDKLHVVMQSNIIRLIQPDTSDTGWKFLLETLINLLSSSKTHPEVRIKATNVLNELLVAVAISEEKSPEGCDAVRGRSLEALSNEISALGMDQSQTTRSSRECEMEIHRLALEALKSILEHCGDSLDTGWTSILLIINSIFGPPSTQRGQSDNTATPSTWSPKLIRSAFGSLQLICSDFLGIVSPSHLLTLLDTLQLFCAQDQDLNISLTVSVPIGSPGSVL